MNEAIARAQRVAEVCGVRPERFAEEIVPAYRPVVLRGLVEAWPSVAAGQHGLTAMASYIRRFDAGLPATLFAGAPEIGGRFFYRDDWQGFNFQSAKVLLPILLDQLVAQAGNADAASLYAGSASAADHYPGWAAENVLPLPTPGGEPRLWIGNSSRVSTHYDISHNIAAVVSGRRRFVLFPPAQAANLYVGPLETTIAGQPVSMVDIEAPDLKRFPRFAEALPTMLVAELEPGDALFVPSLWWHDVRATGPLNVLVNYWWGQDAGSSPFAALIHGVLAIRDLPAPEREAMRAWFDHYVFGAGAKQAADHLPPAARGILGPPSAKRDGAIRGFLQRVFDRN